MTWVVDGRVRGADVALDQVDAGGGGRGCQGQGRADRVGAALEGGRIDRHVRGRVAAALLGTPQRVADLEVVRARVVDRVDGAMIVVAAAGRAELSVTAPYPGSLSVRIPSPFCTEANR